MGTPKSEFTRVSLRAFDSPLAGLPACFIRGGLRAASREPRAVSRNSRLLAQGFFGKTIKLLLFLAVRFQLRAK
jgi:hypothetical protein